MLSDSLHVSQSTLKLLRTGFSSVPAAAQETKMEKNPALSDSYWCR